MRKIEFPMISMGESNLDDIVNELQSIKNDDINYYYDFLGHRLYSDTVTLDSAYKEIYKLSRQEYREKLQEIYKIYKGVPQSWHMSVIMHETKENQLEGS